MRSQNHQLRWILLLLLIILISLVEWINWAIDHLASMHKQPQKIQIEHTPLTPK